MPTDPHLMQTPDLHPRITERPGPPLMQPSDTAPHITDSLHPHNTASPDSGARDSPGAHTMDSPKPRISQTPGPHPRATETLTPRAPAVNPRIVFMGTPEYAVASLDAIVKAGYNVVGVVTAPDKPAGRGMQLTQSAVKKYAVEKGLNILQPEKLKAPLFLDALRALQADLQIVVAFRMLPEIVWSMPPMGTVNLHGSLLPQYRGAAPINWAVINGEKETGVTTFQLQHAIDTGSILLQDRFPIAETDTAGDVHDRSMIIGARLLVKTIAGLAAGALHGISQDNPPDLKHAPKLFTATCRIDWNKPTVEVYNLIRGLSPFPAAFTELDGKLLKIFRSEKRLAAPAISAGNYETDGKTYLRFATSDGCIEVIELQLEGKKRMLVEEFLRGYRFNN